MWTAASLGEKAGFHLQTPKELRDETAELLMLLCDFSLEASSWYLKTGNDKKRAKFENRFHRRWQKAQIDEPGISPEEKKKSI